MFVQSNRYYVHQEIFIKEVWFSSRNLWKQMTGANNSIFREMILLFMKKECFELLYWNFSACNAEGVL